MSLAFVPCRKFRGYNMEFIVNTFSNLSSMPLIEYVAVGFVFACVFSLVYRVIGVKI